MKLLKNLITMIFLLLVSSTTTIGQEKSLPNIGVWIMSNYTYDDTENLDLNSSFNLKHARFILKGNGAKNWGYHLMGEMMSPKDSKPVLLQAWVSYKLNSYLRFRMGQFKYPFGYEAYPARIYWKFINPSYVTSGVAKKLGKDGGFFRDVGFEAAGEYAFSKKLSGLYKFMMFNGSGINNSDFNRSKDYVLFAGLKLPMNVTLGGSYYIGESGFDESEVDETAFGALFKIINKRFSAQAEYISAEYKSETEAKTIPTGFYAFGTYKIIPAIEIGIRYDKFDKDENLENNGASRFTFMTGYYLNKMNRVILNYEIRDDESNEDIGNLLTIQFQAAL